MTNLQAIKANISSAHGVVLDENHFVKALADVGLVADGAYTSDKKIDIATIKLYEIILGGASLTEGHLSYTLVDSARQAKEALEQKLGISRNAVRSPKVW